MYKTFILAFIIFLTNIVYAQPGARSYTLTGTINKDTGKIILMSVSSDTTYYQFRSNIVADIIHGKFVFTDSNYYPSPFLLGVRENGLWKYISGMFFVDTGLQAIVCNIDSNREIPGIYNNSMNEWRNRYSIKFTDVNNASDKLSGIRDSLKKVYGNKIPGNIALAFANKKDSINNERQNILVRYAIEYPHSYIVLWTLVRQLRVGYELSYDSVYNLLSTSVKNTHTGLRLAEKLKTSRTIAIGTIFPQLHLLDINFNSVIMPVYKKNKYTLVDFWFSHCPACKSQFPLLKKLYAEYKNNRFEIIGISIDDEEHIQDWEKVINKQELAWPQFLDKNQKNAKLLSIETYPTNFLLDQNGIIIKRNISLEELGKILAE